MKQKFTRLYFLMKILVGQNFQKTFCKWFNK